MHQNLNLIYMASRDRSILHPATPFVDFICQVALATDVGRKAALEAGVLHVLLFMLEDESSVYAAFRGTDIFRGSQELLDACCSALIALTRDADADSPGRGLSLYHDQDEVNNWIVELAWSQIENSETCRLCDILYKCSRAEQQHFLSEFIAFVSPSR